MCNVKYIPECFTFLLKINMINPPTTSVGAPTTLVGAPGCISWSSNCISWGPPSSRLLQKEFPISFLLVSLALYCLPYISSSATFFFSSFVPSGFSCSIGSPSSFCYRALFNRFHNFILSSSESSNPTRNASFSSLRHASMNLSSKPTPPTLQHSM